MTLSPQEERIMRYVAQGLDIKQMAALMFLSQKAVESSRHKILEKLGAKNMAHAVALWLRLKVPA